MAVEAAEAYRRKQAELGRPMDPREPLKRTAGNNWVHVVCAIWTPEIRFGKAQALAPSEGIGSIPMARYEQSCKLCKTTEGACVACHQCHATVHVGCAHKAGYTFGFDITPVKGSRRDTVNTITLGSETGNATAAIWCKEHSVKTIVHPMSEVVDNGKLNALQLFVRTYKQADLTLTGTVRKANLVSSSNRSIGPSTVSTSTRRASAAHGALPSGTPQSSSRSSRISPTAVTVKSEEIDVDGDRVVHLSDTVVDPASEKECVTCGSHTSPKWHKSSRGRAGASVPLPAPVVEGPTSAHMVNGCQAPQNHEIDARSDAVCATLTALTNGHHSGDEARDDVGNSTPALRVEAQTIPDKATGQVPVFQCHKCHLKRPRDPTPVEKTPPPPPMPSRSQQESAQHASQPPPPTQLVWPPMQLQRVTVQGHVTMQGRQSQPWPNPVPPMQTGPPTAPHIEHSLSTQQPTSHPPNHSFHPPPVQHQMEGFSFGPGVRRPYQIQGVSFVHLVPAGPRRPSHQALIVPPHAHVTNGVPVPHPQAYHQAHLSNGLPSYRPAENPFTGPPQSSPHTIPTLASGHGSPHTVRERPTTPMENGSGVRPESAGRVVNGASASPSLRNLLS